MADEPAPEFPQNSLPGVAAMLASLEAGRAAKGLAARGMNSAPTALRQIVGTAGTPLEEIAEFTRGEVDDLIAFAASKGVHVPIMSAPNTYFSRGAPLAKRILDKIDPSVSPGVANKLRELGVAGGLEPHIGLSRASVPSAMHEIGHATPLLGSRTLRDVWQGIATVMGSKIGDPARALLAINALSEKKDGESEARAFARENAASLMAASFAPELIEEARATGHALAGARKFGPGVIATAREMLPALGTYAAHAAGPVAGVLLAQRIMSALRERGEEKRAAPTAGKEVQTPGILRSPASSAWRMGVSAPKPKSIKPNTSSTARAKETPKAKPPSKTAFYSDVVKSLNNPQRGFRQAKPES
jgi:hypothetical protein